VDVPHSLPTEAEHSVQRAIRCLASLTVSRVVLVSEVSLRAICSVTEDAGPALQVRFVLMNSFSTSEDTKAFLSSKHGDLLAEDDVELVQNKSPKIDAKTLEPATHPANPEQEWCAADWQFLWVCAGATLDASRQI